MTFFRLFGTFQNLSPKRQILNRLPVPFQHPGLSIRTGKREARIHHNGRRIFDPQAEAIKKLLTFCVSRQYSRAGSPVKNSNGSFAARAKRIAQKS